MFYHPNLLATVLSTTLLGIFGTALSTSADISAVLPTSERVVEDRIWEAEDVDYVPEMLNYEQVKELVGYPEVARKAGIQGDVVLRVLVDKDGKYVRHEVLQSDHPLLRIPCEVFSSLLTFKPALKDEATVSCWTTVTFGFEIPGYGG